MFRTKLSQQRLRVLFEEKVARAGWKNVNEADPIVAQAGFIVGAQQQIALRFAGKDDDDMIYAMIAPHTWIQGLFMPKKKPHHSDTFEQSHECSDYRRSRHGGDPRCAGPEGSRLLSHPFRQQL